jgi:hypothetical protein
MLAETAKPAEPLRKSRIFAAMQHCPQARLTIVGSAKYR